MGRSYLHAHFIDRSQPHYVAKLEAHKKGHSLFPELVTIIYNRWRNEGEVKVNTDYDGGKGALESCDNAHLANLEE